ncbi:carbon monoxide dehydrogenase [Maritimibacter sp. 55A14]|uniref:MHYT domain-containing protein n=1 Tax=Maritimibacter sp. 55A14 TaxID=2174844 RepID=UPI000D61EC84|nr:MHYT domain-containing protein [Maritimibacter sp. 55A14]PWE34237.1 carbon monoxide dehydrogenase [Maritimibacter sp. 55A14]
MLVYSYDIRLVLASVAISMMAAFTGLALTRGLSAMPMGIRQLRIAMAAVALGGGIWSMHFVAMLAMRFNVAVYYEALRTVASVLIAILLAGLALLLMHFGPRRGWKSVAAGAVLGLGIVVMHYVGLSGIEGCLPVYDPTGYAVAGGLAVGMGIVAIRVAYGRRTGRNILLATLIFGGSVVIVHFTAMYWTDFAATAGGALPRPAMDNEQLALIVLFSGFVISGAFLLSGARFLSGAPGGTAMPEEAPSAPPAGTGPRVPFERDGITYFLPAGQVAAIRAEGHYTIAYTEGGRVFCPWSITEAERRLSDGAFFRAHRSYLVNTGHVSGFERRKDNGVCLFEGFAHLEKVPVSRARVAALRDRLGL